MDRRHNIVVSDGDHHRLADRLAGHALARDLRSLYLLVPSAPAPEREALACTRGASLDGRCRLAVGITLALARDPDQPDDRVRPTRSTRLRSGDDPDQGDYRR